MSCYIDGASAGSYADAFEEGARKFCDGHPNERWTVVGRLDQGGLEVTLSTSTGDHNQLKRVIGKVLDDAMADAVCVALEEMRASES